jgi:hypothetical protein
MRRKRIPRGRSTCHEICEVRRQKSEGKNVSLLPSRAAHFRYFQRVGYDGSLGNVPMTEEIVGLGTACATILLSASFVLSAQQSSSARPAKSSEQKQTSKSTPDNWQKMKDCSAQAEKAMAERDRRSISFGGHGSDGWSDHYSPKYNRCFVRAEYVVAVKDRVKGGPMFYTYLIDAFEQVNLASSASGPSAQLLCRNEEDPKECERGAAIVWNSTCNIEDEKVECAKAKQFIDEHMKN